MMIDRMLLHPQTRKRLDGVVASPAHAYLFYGPSGSGKKTAALTVAARIVASLVDAKTAARISRGEHEHVILISPQSTGKSIKISQIKELVRDLGLKTYIEGLPRFVIIEEAQLMTDEAANALLKVLEEPPENTMIILLAPSPVQVLPTISSRTATVAFLPPGSQAIKKYLESEAGLSLDDARVITELSTGQPGLAWRLAADADLRQQLITGRQLADEFLAGSITARFKIAQDIHTQGAAEAFMRSLIEITRQEFLASGQNDQLLQKLIDCENYLGHNLNARLVIEHLALETAQ